MPYSKAFFELQLKFAQKILEKFGGEMDDILFNYTTFPRSIDLLKPPFDHSNLIWRQYIQGLRAAGDPAEWTYNYYLAHHSPEPTSKDTEIHGHKPFGGFYFVLRNEHIIRPHSIRLADDLSPYSPFSSKRLDESLGNLKRMFQFIKETIEGTNTVVGNSWMYNLEAYRRLFPSEYTKDMKESSANEFQFLALWGQFFDWKGDIKAHLAEQLLSRIERIANKEQLRHCFPFQVMMPKYGIQAFYDFYGIE